MSLLQTPLAGALGLLLAIVGMAFIVVGLLRIQRGRPASGAQGGFLLPIGVGVVLVAAISAMGLLGTEALRATFADARWIAQVYLPGLPAFLLYFAGGLAYLGVFGVVYSQVTRHHELRLIRAGNVAAILAFLGALGGFALPLAKSIAQSANFLDFAVWATVALLVQILAYVVAYVLKSDVTRKMNEGDLGTGIWLGGFALIFGVLNSASMTYVP